MSNTYDELVNIKAQQIKDILKECDSTQVLKIMQDACNELLDEAELDVFYENYDPRDDTEEEDEDNVAVEDLLPEDD